MGAQGLSLVLGILLILTSGSSKRCDDKGMAKAEDVRREAEQLQMADSMREAAAAYRRSLKHCPKFRSPLMEHYFWNNLGWAVLVTVD